MDHMYQNMGYFLVGAALLWNFHKIISLATLIGAISFFFAYTCVYIFNDIHDLEEDKNHILYLKKDRPLVRGEIKKKTAMKIWLVFLIISIVSSLFTNFLFSSLILSMLIINFIYTLKLKKQYPLLGLFLLLIVQYFKVLVGWVSSFPSLQEFPILIPALISFAYGFSMAPYRYNQGRISKKSYQILLVIFGILTLFSYIFSLLFYTSISNALLMLFVGGFLISPFLYLKYKRKELGDILKYSLKFFGILFITLAIAIFFI